MLFRIVIILGSWLLDLLAVLSSSDHHKDLEILILRHQNEMHLMSVLKEYADYHNERRPHQGLAQRMQVMPTVPSENKRPTRRRDVLGGVIRDYYRQVA